MRTRTSLRIEHEGGQAAVEAAFSIPVLLVLFLIGLELFAVTWNAQFAHVRARYDAFYGPSGANHQACPPPQGLHEEWTGQERTQVKDIGISGRTYTIDQRYVIMCP